jgi:serine/threonine protein kinase
MIGSGSFSKVYLGTWSGRRVAIKVLSSYTSASLFRQEVEIWRKLRHENVLRMWGASSAQGDRPWFIVSEYCGGGSLIGWLRERKAGVCESDVVGPLSPPSAGTGREVDLLRCMHHISKGMLYLHNENVLHGDLKVSADV